MSNSVVASRSSVAAVVSLVVSSAGAKVVAGVLDNPCPVQFSVTLDEASVGRLDDGQLEESYKSTFESLVTVSS